jgi:hypothetical protein
MNAQHKCANCGRLDSIQHQTDTMLCLACGRLTDYQGRLCPSEPQFVVPPGQGPVVKDGAHGR